MTDEELREKAKALLANEMGRTSQAPEMLQIALAIVLMSRDASEKA